MQRKYDVQSTQSAIAADITSSAPTSPPSKISTRSAPPKQHPERLNSSQRPIVHPANPAVPILATSCFSSTSDPATAPSSPKTERKNTLLPVGCHRCDFRTHQHYIPRRSGFGTGGQGGNAQRRLQTKTGLGYFPPSPLPPPPFSCQPARGSSSQRKRRQGNESAREELETKNLPSSVRRVGRKGKRRGMIDERGPKGTFATIGTCLSVPVRFFSSLFCGLLAHSTGCLAPQIHARQPCGATVCLSLPTFFFLLSLGSPPPLFLCRWFQFSSDVLWRDRLSAIPCLLSSCTSPVPGRIRMAMGRAL